MKKIETPLKDVFVIEPNVFGDERGFFMETWNANVFRDMGLDLNFVQDNHSKSRQGILRGLHYQTKHTQGKLVRVTHGAVIDVAVDLRKDSPSFGLWHSVILSEENKKLFWVPPGFAHGFYVISDEAEFLYKCTDFYDPGSEVSLAWNDPALGINWQLVNDEPPQLSAKDAEGLSWEDCPKF